jgi:glycosyltransferase involved in cell wall biosynthesis
MKRAHFFIDNLNIGGFQRLCLDQAYALSELGYSVEIHSLSELPASNSKNFLTIEENYLSRLCVKIDSFSTSHFRQISQTQNILRNHNDGDVLISHSLRATAIIYLSSRLLLKRRLFVTEIHQLPTLSAPIQRFRRFLYAQFSPVLIAYSEAVKNDWELRVKNFPVIIRPFFNKRIEVIRNGIYLDRLPQTVNSQESKSPGRLIFLGRNTAWKGITTFLQYAEHPKLLNLNILLMLPDIDPGFELEINERFGPRVEIIIGKSIASFSPKGGDVHFYSAQYGTNAKFIESISLNCLEMAAAGVPSVVTRHGLSTWSDLRSVGVFYECDWSESEETAETILHASRNRLGNSEIERIRSLISIKSNVLQLIRRGNFE